MCKNMHGIQNVDRENFFFLSGYPLTLLSGRFRTDNQEVVFHSIHSYLVISLPLVVVMATSIDGFLKELDHFMAVGSIGGYYVSGYSLLGGGRGDAAFTPCMCDFPGASD